MTLARIAYFPRYLTCYTLILAAVPVMAVGAVCMVALACIGRCMIWVSP